MPTARGRDRYLLPLVVLGLGLLACAIVLLFLGRHLVLSADEWTFARERRGFDAGAFLDPHNGHLVLVPALIFKALYATVGLAELWPYRLALIVFHLAIVALIYVL